MKLIQVGRTKKGFTEEAIEHYRKRIGKYAHLELITVSSAKGKKSKEEVRLEEEKGIKERIPKQGILVLLDERGKKMNSVDFAENLREMQERAGKHLTFVIGGAYGFSEAFRKEAQHRIALSEMTLSHQVARIVLMEQLYRALSILHGDPYHNA